MSDKKLEVSAPCKINLHLRVGDKRQDGFHGVESIFLPVSLCDTLIFEETEFTGTAGGSAHDTIRVDAAALPRFFADKLQGTELPLEKNIVYKAKKLFAEKIGRAVQCRITLIKRIPQAAGLGGGSSDAAAALMALNTLAGGLLSYNDLLCLAAALGSDVPYFITHSGLPQTEAAYVSGRGEKIKLLQIPQYNLVLVNPCIASSTSAAFALLDEYRKEDIFPHNLLLEIEQLQEMIMDDPEHWVFHNDFLDMFLNKSETSDMYIKILTGLRKNGAAFAGLSGSGASCFGVFNTETAARQAEKALSNEWGFVRSVILP